MDTGSNRPLLQMNVESIAEVKVLTSRTTRPNTAARAACRSPPSPRAAPTASAARSTTSSATPTGTPTARPTSSTATRRPSRSSGTGAIRSAARSASRAATTSCSSSTPRSSSRAPAGNDVVRFRMPTALERQGDFSQTTDNNGNPYPYIKDPKLAGLRARPRARQPAFADGGVLGKIPGEPALPDRPEHPEHVSDAEHCQCPGRPAVQLRAHPAVREHPELAAGGPPRLSADAEACARRSSTPAGSSGSRPSTARFPASTTRSCSIRSSARWRRRSTTP